jgi:hypothetical protein
MVAAVLYSALWLLTAVVGTRNVCGDFRQRSHVDGTFVTISCSEVPDYNAIDHGYGCCAASYAPFLVVVHYAYCDQGFSTGGSAVFLWLGRSWPVLPWPWGHSWIT